MVRVISIIILLSILPAGCQSATTPYAATSVTTATSTSALEVPPTGTAAPTPTPPPTIADTIVDGNKLTLFVDSQIKHQVIQDVTGGNFINVFSGTTDPTEAVSQYNLDHLPVRVARVRMTLEKWEPANDDSNPNQFNWEAFQDTEYNHATFLLMQKLQARGTQIIATSWDLPDWLVSNPSSKTQRFVPYENYPELVEIVASWLVFARDHYGVEPLYVSFNEPDVGAYISLAPFEAIMLIEQAGKRFDELGIKTKWLIADTANIGGSDLYARSVLKEEGIRPYLGVLANHSWDSDASDASYLDVRAFALKNHLDVWCTELGSEPFAWTKPEVFPTYAYALELARIYSRVLKLSGANTLLYWEMMGKDYWINDGTQAYPSFHVIRQLGEQIPPGAVIVETSKNTENFYSVAVQAPDHFMVFMVNTGDAALTVTLQGLPDGSYTHIQTTQNELGTVAGTYTVPQDTVSISIPSMSIHVLTTRKP